MPSHFSPAAFVLAGCLGICSATASSAAPILVGAFVDPNGLSTPATVLQFEASLGATLGVDHNYSRFNWSGELNREQWDITGGRIPLKSWSPTVLGASCVLLTDVTAGVYDAQLKAQAAQVKALTGTLWMRLFYEMTDNQAERCANPARSGAVYIAAWQHIVGLFRAAGATNVKWVWAPGENAYAKGAEMAYYPGSSWVDIVGEDNYNKTPYPVPFAATVCTVGPQLGKPFALTETGAGGVTNQLAWLDNVKTACPGLTAFVYWDAIGGAQNYVISDPSAFAALKAIGEP
jgi:mannan endo-1,4-beta-mannosidase